ncbi:MAG: DHA2 family efflux MFS transporter permease subunit [Myxococcales bacterium]
MTASQPARAGRPPTNKWLVTVSVTFGTLMGTIDASIVNVALPHMRGSVGATLEEITWVVTGFVIATVIVMPLTAFLGRFFGQKRVYLVSLALFVAGSMLCGTARSLAELVAFRALQGLGAGALQPTEQAILRQTFPPEEQGMAMALFAMAVMIGPAVGPTLGGFIVDNYSWPWIFYVNLPVGLLGLFMVSRFVHEPEDVRQALREQAAAQRKNLDWQGIALMCVGLGGLQFVLEEGQRYDWFESSTIGATSLVAAFALAAFAVRELTAPAPAVNLRLFKDKVFLSGTLIGAVMFAMLMANMFLLPVFMQTLLGFTALQSGLALMPRVLVMMVFTPVVGRIYNRVSPRLLVGFGIAAFAVGAWQMSHFTAATSMRQIISAIMIQGLGFSCLFVPLTTVALTTIERARLTDATGLNSLFRQIGGSVGLAVFATLLVRYSTQARAGLVPHLSRTDPRVAERVSGPKGVLALQGLVEQQAAVLSFEKLFLLSGVLFLCVLPLLYLLRADHPGAGRPAPVAEH